MSHFFLKPITIWIVLNVNTKTTRSGNIWMNPKDEGGFISVNHVEDQILVQRSLQGEQKAFEQLVKRYQKSIYNLAYRMTGSHEDAGDLAQETFLHAYEKLKTFQIGRRFSPWLFRIASNLCINWQNRQKWRAISLDSLSEDKKERLLRSDVSADPAFQLERNQLQTLLQQEILALPVRYRLVFTLRYIEDHSCRQIAEILDMPEGTVKTYLFRARRILKKKLKNFY